MKDFFTEFRNDHRQIRDLIMDLKSAFIRKEMSEAGNLVERLNSIAGPHFLFEEQCLYQELIPVYGMEYIDKLYIDHDLLIARIKTIKGIIEKKDLSDEDVEKGLNLLRGLLPHLSDCEGLTIMVERFDQKEIVRIFASLKNARLMNTGLLEWSDKGRKRKELIITN